MLNVYALMRTQHESNKQEKKSKQQQFEQSQKEIEFIKSKNLT